MKMPIIWVGVSALALHAVPAVAQDHSQMDHAQHSTAPTPNAGPVDHSKMDHAKMGHDMAAMPAATSGNPAEGSGTSRLPGNEGGMHGLHLPVAKDWMVMTHGYVWGVTTDQSGPRGDDKTYVQSMAMLTAERQFEGGRFQFKSMLSLEPLMSNRGYPNLFATGETAGGAPLVDRQRVDHFDGGRAVGPEVDHAPAELALGHQQLDARGVAVAGVEARRVQDRRAGVLFAET